MKYLFSIILAFICLMSFKESERVEESEKNETVSTICKVPEVSDSKLFDAIISKYKGKVVVVDFWGTWCSPCIADIKFMEPLKDTELKNDNLVFVYIADESSPEEQWLSMIREIKGEHYRLSKKQWRYIGNKFKFTRVPSYVHVNKNGKSKLRNDLHIPDVIKKVLIEDFPQ